MDYKIDLGKRRLSIKEFKFDSVVEKPVIIVIAKRGSGISWMIRDIINHSRDISADMIISETK